MPESLTTDQPMALGGRNNRSQRHTHTQKEEYNKSSNQARGYKTFLCSTHLSIKIIMLINVKMPTIVGILTFIIMINTTSESIKAKNIFVFQHFSFCEQLKFHAQLS